MARWYAIRYDDKVVYRQGHDEDIARMVREIKGEVKITRDDKPGNWCDTFTIRNDEDIEHWLTCCKLIENEHIRYYVRDGRYAFRRLHEYDRDELMKLRRPKMF